MTADSSRYLLYIDVLGFSELVEEGTSRIGDLFEVIASLYVHDQSANRTDGQFDREQNSEAVDPARHFGRERSRLKRRRARPLHD